MNAFRPELAPPGLHDIIKKYLRHEGTVTLHDLTDRPDGYYSCKKEGDQIVDSWGAEAPPDFNAKRAGLQRKISKHEISVKKLQTRLEEHQKHCRYRDAERAAAFLQRTKGDIEAFKNEIQSLYAAEEGFLKNEAEMYQSRIASMVDEKKAIDAEMKKISARLAELDSEK
ncbi:MAG TPA: hypothetical protein PKX12_13605 [Spirochaetota bacterium]|nr:hypothetical protein [Spirochaetota bacterium]